MKYIKLYESIRYNSSDILNCAWYFKNKFNIENVDDVVDWRYEMIDLKNKRERYIKYFFTTEFKYNMNKIKKYFKSIGLNAESEKFYADSFELNGLSVVIPIQQVCEFSRDYEIMKTAKKYNL